MLPQQSSLSLILPQEHTKAFGAAELTAHVFSSWPQAPQKLPGECMHMHRPVLMAEQKCWLQA